MTNPVTLSALATTFVAMGALLGLPSLTVLVLYAVKTVHDRLSTAPAGLAIGDNPDALLLMLAGLVKAFGLLARLVDFVFDVLAVGAAVGLLLGVALWLTGRGLQAHAAWARASGGVLLVLTLLPSLLLALSMQGSGRLVMLLLVVGCALGLQLLWSWPLSAPPTMQAPPALR